MPFKKEAKLSSEEGSREAADILVKNALTPHNIFERPDRHEFIELMTCISYHWLLSNDDHKDKIKLAFEPTDGISQSLKISDANVCLILLPCSSLESSAYLDYREIHQLYRELMTAVYVLNQLPSLTLDAAFDKGTHVLLPPAFCDTYIGALMTQVDYMMKSLWLGSSMPNNYEQRVKFNKKWKAMFDVNIYGKSETVKNIKDLFVDADMFSMAQVDGVLQEYTNLLKSESFRESLSANKELLESSADMLSLEIFFYLLSIKQYIPSSVIKAAPDCDSTSTHEKDSSQFFPSIFKLDTSYNIDSCIHSHAGTIDNETYESMTTCLQHYEDLIRHTLHKLPGLEKSLTLLRLVSFLVPFLVGCKKKLKIPDISQLLPPLSVKDCKTEREFPPLLSLEDLPDYHFSSSMTNYFHLHGDVEESIRRDILGVKFDLLTPMPDYANFTSEEHDFFSKLLNEEEVRLTKYVFPTTKIDLESELIIRKVKDEAGKLAEYPVRKEVIDGQSYHVIQLPLMDYAPQKPYKPAWVQMHAEKSLELRERKALLTEVQLHDQFKKHFGFKEALKLKNQFFGLRAAATKGLDAAFNYLAHRSPPKSWFTEENEQGLAPIHLAAMFDRPYIIVQLLTHDANIEQRRFHHESAACTALHIAARCGSIEATACLIGCGADMLAADENGWVPVHHAAFAGHVPIVHMMVQKISVMRDFQTYDPDVQATPLHIASESGALSVVRYLVDIGADVPRKDKMDRDVIYLAASHLHTHIIKYFIDLNNKELCVWSTFLRMLSADTNPLERTNALCCLEKLTKHISNLFQPFYETGVLDAVMKLLDSSNDNVRLLAITTVCNISKQEQEAVGRHLASSAITRNTLISLLHSKCDELRSRTAYIIGDVAAVAVDITQQQKGATTTTNNADAPGLKNAVEPLVTMLAKSAKEHTLLNVVNTIRRMCASESVYQDLFAKQGAIPLLVDLLVVDSEILRAATAATVGILTTKHIPNQSVAIQCGCVEPLVSLLKCRTPTIQVQAANAVRALAENNPESQKVFLDLKAVSPLIRLLSLLALEGSDVRVVKEQAAETLWTLAGTDLSQQKLIAETVSLKLMFDLVLTHSEILQYYGLSFLTAYCSEEQERQIDAIKGEMINPLVWILKGPKASYRVRLAVVKFLGVLCIGVAHTANPVTQAMMCSTDLFVELVSAVRSRLTPDNVELVVESAVTLACICLRNEDNMNFLRESTYFTFNKIARLLDSVQSEGLRLRAGYAMALFAFSSKKRREAMMTGSGRGLRWSFFEPFVQSENELYQCNANFQVVVLHEFFQGLDRVELVATGISRLVSILRSSKDHYALELAAKVLASLCHLRAGLSDIILSCGGLHILIDLLLNHPHKLVTVSSATALGYLSFNAAGTRELVKMCRLHLELYDLIVNNLPSDKISPRFTEDYRIQKATGIPSECAQVQERIRLSRPHTRGAYHESKPHETWLRRLNSAPSLS